MIMHLVFRLYHGYYVDVVGWRSDSVAIVAPYGLGVYTVHSKIRVYSTLAVLPIMHYCIIRCVGIIRCTVSYAYIRRLQESKHRMVQL